MAVLGIPRPLLQLSTEREAGATFLGMRRTAEVLTTLILFAVVMTAIGWGVSATVPGGVDWLWDRVGGGAVWAAIIAFWVIGGYFAWRSHRPSAGRAVGR